MIFDIIWILVLGACNLHIFFGMTIIRGYRELIAEYLDQEYKERLAQ